MKIKIFKLFPLCFCILVLLTFCVPVAAAESSYYADEEEGNYHNGTMITPFHSISPLAEKDGNLIVVLDPGHGGDDSGAAANGAKERDLNMKVALYCKQYLERYDNVTVYLTRSDNKTYYTLAERAQIAANKGADLLISLHFNANNSHRITGTEAYVSHLEEYTLKGLADNIVQNLHQLGPDNRGVKIRESENNTYWIDGIRLADYYGMIRNPAYHEIPATIVEHCFIDSSDYANFANTDAKLKAMGEADAKAVVTYFRLDEKISETTLANKKYTALEELEQQYNALELSNYNSAFRARISAVYEDAKARIENATGTGKIDLTLNRACKTWANYPVIDENETMFSDVKKNDWFLPAVDYCVTHELFFGTTENTFSPNKAITRGMFIAVLGRTAGVEEKTPCETKFSDVPATQYYAPHIQWATEHDIVAGISETLYKPDTEIRREDILRMLHNYCLSQEIEIEATSTKTIGDFKDGDTVDSWAIDAMNWGITCGIIQGDDTNNLHPRESASRAEVAQIMMMFTKSINTDPTVE